MTETKPKNPKQTPRNKKPMEIKKENDYFPVILILVSFVLQFSFYSFDEGDYGVKNNLFGVVGHLISKAGFYLFGKAIYILPVVGFLSGMILFQKKEANKFRLFTSLPFLILSLSIFLHIIGSNTSSLRGLEGNKIGGWGAEVASIIQEKAFHELKCPVQRVGAMDIPIPSSGPMENKVLPSAKKVIETINIISGI